MDREEFRAKTEIINQLVYEKKYKEALELVDSIEWKKVKEAHALYTAGEVYAANKRYQESKEIFLMAYERSPARKNILYRLIEVSIKMQELEEAWKYYQLYLEIAPNDNTQYILKYKIYCAQEAPLEEQIQILEEYKEKEYTERWSYELAKLYYKAGEEQICLEICDDIVLWFSEGEYVLKALELKQRLTNLSPKQKEIYERLLEPEEPEPLEEEEKIASVIEPVEADSFENEKMGANSAEAADIDVSENEDSGDFEEMAPIMEDNDSLQEKISKGIKDIFAGIVKEWESEDDFLGDYPSIPKLNIADVIPPEKVEASVKEKQEKEMEVAASEEDSDIKQASEEAPEEFVESEQKEENVLEEEQKLSEEAEPEIVPDLEEKTEKETKQTAKDQKKQREAIQDPEEAEKLGEKIIKFDASKLPKLELPDFNLEDVILSAAEKQGIGVPNEQEEPEPDPEPDTNPQEEEPDEDLSEDFLEDEEEEATQKAGALEEEAEEPEKSEEELPEEELPEPDPEPVVIAEKVQPEGEIRPQEEILSQEESLIQFIESKDARNSEDEDVIIPREETLDEVETKLFSYFSTIPGMKEQLVEVLADAQLAATDKTSRFGNIIVMGNLRTGKTRLTQGLIRTICRELRMPAARVATVDASQLNGEDIPKIVSKLAGGFLVIQKTNQLTADSVFQLNQAMEFRTDGLTVILEDEKIGMRKFIAKYQKFTKKFTSTINIPVFTNDELVHFAKVYADEMGYVMDTMGVLALYNLIGDNQKEDEPMTIGTVKDMMDAAITKAESSHRKIQRSIAKKRFDDEGKVILYEKDFK